MITPEFVAAEVAYRSERLAADYRAGDAAHKRRRRLPLYLRLRLPALRRRERVGLRSLPSR